MTSDTLDRHDTQAGRLIAWVTRPLSLNLLLLADGLMADGPLLTGDAVAVTKRATGPDQQQPASAVAASASASSTATATATA